MKYKKTIYFWGLSDFIPKSFNLAQPRSVMLRTSDLRINTPSQDPSTQFLRQDKHKVDLVLIETSLKDLEEKIIDSQIKSIRESQKGEQKEYINFETPIFITGSFGYKPKIEINGSNYSYLPTFNGGKFHEVNESCLPLIEKVSEVLGIDYNYDIASKTNPKYFDYEWNIPSKFRKYIIT